MRHVATFGAVAGAAYLIVVPLVHIHSPVYPHAAPYAAMSHVREHPVPAPTPNPYLPLAPAPSLSQPTSSASAASSGGGHHLIGGYIAYRMMRHIFPRRRNWGFRSPIRNPLPWWMR